MTILHFFIFFLSLLYSIWSGLVVDDRCLVQRLEIGNLFYSLQCFKCIGTALMKRKLSGLSMSLMLVSSYILIWCSVYVSITVRLPCSVSVDFLACCQHSFSSSCTYFSSFFFLASDIFFAVHTLLWSVKLTILMFMPWTKIQVLVRQWNQLSLPLFFSPLLMTGCQTCWLAFSWW